MTPYSCVAYGICAGVLIGMLPAKQLQGVYAKDNSVSSGLFSIFSSYILMHVCVFIYNKLYHDTIALFAGVMVICFLGCLGAMCLRNRKCKDGAIRKE